MTTQKLLDTSKSMKLIGALERNTHWVGWGFLLGIAWGISYLFWTK